MKSYLLDVNVLVAWGWMDHADHQRASAWIQQNRQSRGPMLLTSSIPQLGFIRVSVQRSAGRVSVGQAAKVLHGMLASLGASHQFLTDDHIPSNGLMKWCGSAAQTTDAHLLGLAKAYGAHLATLDTGIPEAFLLPEFSSNN